MRLGFVGVGKHATKMAAAFRECGAEVVAHWRNYKVGGGFAIVGSEWGRAVPWAEQITDGSIDALIICAPPEVTTEVALACAKAGKRCVATKPLMWRLAPAEHGYRNNAVYPESFYVDLWRLYSPAWQAMKTELRGKQIQSVHVDFYGNGPVRSFSGLLDYGPHALAFVADLLGNCEGLEWTELDSKNGTGSLWGASSNNCSLVTGDGADGPRTSVQVVCDDGNYDTILWEESRDHTYDIQQVYSLTGEMLASNSRSLALRNFCRAFLAGEPSDTLRISCEAMRVLMPLVS